jgi:DNA-binding phage protein
MGYDRASVYRWACDETRPTVHNLEDMATTLGFRLAVVPLEGKK